MTTRDDARDAGLVLRHALARDIPGRTDGYQQLLDRFNTDPQLREVVTQTAAGLGLKIAGADQTLGLLLTADADSPMAVSNVTPWLKTAVPENRMIYGVALAGVAACCYPTATSVRQPGTRRVTAVDVDELIRTHAQAIATGDVVLDDGLADAWEAYENCKAVEETHQGSLKKYCTVKMCDDAMAMLADFGLLMPDRTIDPPRPELTVWRSTDRFRTHVATSGGPMAWQTLAHSPVPAAVVGEESRR